MLSQARADFELLKSNPIEYKTKVNRISDLLNAKFVDDYPPAYFVGDYADGRCKDVVFGLNPGFNAKRDRQQRIENFESWEDYLKFLKGFFDTFKKETATVPFYRYLSKLFGGISHVELNEWPRRWNFFQANLVTLNLIPYHSKGYKFPSRLGDEQRKYLNDRLKSNLDFLKRVNRVKKLRSVVFNGKIYCILRDEWLENRRPLNKRLNMYLFEYGGIPCILFDKFIPSPAAGVSYEELQDAASKFNDWISSRE